MVERLGRPRRSVKPLGPGRAHARHRGIDWSSNLVPVRAGIPGKTGAAIPGCIWDEGAHFLHWSRRPMLILDSRHKPFDQELTRVDSIAGSKLEQSHGWRPLLQILFQVASQLF